PRCTWRATASLRPRSAASRRRSPIGRPNGGHRDRHEITSAIGRRGRPTRGMSGQDEEQGLLQGILEDPEEGQPRRADAGRAGEKGDPDRAAFTRAQVWLASSSATLTAEGRTELKQQERDLLAAHRQDWEAPLRALGATAVEFRRGLPYGVAMPAQDFLANAGQ